MHNPNTILFVDNLPTNLDCGVRRPIGVDHTLVTSGRLAVIDFDDGQRWVQSLDRPGVLYYDREDRGRVWYDSLDGRKTAVLRDQDSEGLRLLREGVNTAPREEPQPQQYADAELVPIDLESGSEFRVDARDLHARLEIGKVFGAWIKDRIESAGFVENEDYSVCFPKSESKECGVAGKGRGGHNAVEYKLTLDTAKELAMLERTDIGRRVRKYFIRCEKELAKRPIATALDFSDPLTAARLYIEAEEGRRTALVLVDKQERELELKDVEIGEKDSRIDLLTSKVEAPVKCQTLTQFAKATEAVLGMTPPLLFRYLRDAGVLGSQEANGKNRTNVVLAPWNGKGLFQTVVHDIVRTVRDEENRPIGLHTVKFPTPKLTPDKLGADGKVEVAGGWSWLFRKISRDPRSALCRLIASEGGSEGRWAPLYGCRLLPVTTPEGLKTGDDHSVIRFLLPRKKDGGGAYVCRWTEAAYQQASGVTLEKALEALLEATPPGTKKALVKSALFDE
jgi:phage anti-repressor protein